MNTRELAGRLIFHVSHDQAEVINTRSNLAQALLQGSPAASAAQKLAAILSLCGDAHEMTAQLALDTITGIQDSPLRLWLETLHGSTLAEHFRRIWLDWPRLFDVPHTTDMKALAEGVALTRFYMSNGNQLTLQRWVERNVLQMPLDEWLQRWNADPGTWFDLWLKNCNNQLANMLNAISTEAKAIRLPVSPLHPPRDESVYADQISLADALRAAGATNAPIETGCWTRNDTLASKLQKTIDSAWLRLGSRIAEIVSLSLNRSCPLQMGALSLGSRSALAWCEMARGLLVHKVRLDEALYAVESYEVFAPTDCNFHASSVMSCALKQLTLANYTEQHIRKAIAILVATFDPCIPYTIEFHHA